MYLDDSLTSEELSDTLAEMRAAHHAPAFTMVHYQSAMGHAWHVRSRTSEVNALMRDIRSVGGTVLSVIPEGN